MTALQALILAIVEGITEFLPVSSTGHMIIVSSLMGIAADPFVKVFEICIQFGAILSVVVLYFRRFFRDFPFYYRLLAGFLPIVVLGLLLKPVVDRLLENVTVVAVSLLVGGVVLLFVDKWFAKNENLPDAEPGYKQAAGIGLMQAIAMIPGVSRSAATIIGAQMLGLNRKSAAEFSFFLAVPTMFAASVKSLWDERELLAQHTDKLPILLLGGLAAFVVALIAIKAFVGYLTKYGFRAFGWYRIAVGIALLVLLYGFRVELHMF